MSIGVIIFTLGAVLQRPIIRLVRPNKTSRYCLTFRAAGVNGSCRVLMLSRLGSNIASGSSGLSKLVQHGKRHVTFIRVGVSTTGAANFVLYYK